MPKSPSAAEVTRALRTKSNPEKAAFFPRFFKTGDGEYGEGDKFLGVIVPDQRKIAKQFRELSFAQIEALLDSPWHECRLTAVLILVSQYERAESQATRNAIYRFYLEKKERINNWDIVDASAHKIVGPHLWERSRKPLYKLAKSQHLWSNRIAIIATMHFIKRGDFDDTIALSELMLDHPHDLMHKAIGWMLREVGKQDELVLLHFLKAHQHEMPRTMLRYAIEKLPEQLRKKALRGELS